MNPENEMMVEHMNHLRLRIRKIEESIDRMRIDFQVQANIQSLQITELQKRFEEITNAQSKLNESITECLENYDQELHTITKRISTLWETVMKPTQT